MVKNVVEPVHKRSTRTTACLPVFSTGDAAKAAILSTAREGCETFAPLPRRHSKQAFASAVYRMTLANVPAPAEKSTDPKKRTDSKVVRVQRVRMWITLAQALPVRRIYTVS